MLNLPKIVNGAMIIVCSAVLVGGVNAYAEHRNNTKSVKKLEETVPLMLDALARIEERQRFFREQQIKQMAE